MAKDESDAFDHAVAALMELASTYSPEAAVKMLRLIANDIEQAAIPLAKVQAEDRRRLH